MKLPRLSIITAVHAPNSAHLADTIMSVQRQKLPPEWSLEWIIQEDGEQPQLASLFEDVEVAHYSPNGFQLGIAATRNFALARATGDLIQVLDSDDILLEGASASLISLFLDSDIYWAVGQADDLMPDGERVQWDSILPYGRIRAGDVNRKAEEAGGNWPVHCAGLMMRAPALRAIGGWIGLPTDEDIAMFAALSEIGDGFNLDRVTWLYRQHPNQITRSANTEGSSEQARRFALQRATAIRSTGLRFAHDLSRSQAHDSHTVNVLPATKSPTPPR
ncbi:hypothetical protein J2S43_005978 [Catenuloplanes nepalensis]|uniref:Glycosyltransferase 2-like domain-containing protein n=1 Tax=Catenuloplanes nepalensis TaxID=587533 RepID=A0ABT9N2G5_9ACTN|nr:hypothetical protein [Catenuloplanes nepalensis]